MKFQFFNYFTKSWMSEQSFAISSGEVYGLIHNFPDVNDEALGDVPIHGFLYLNGIFLKSTVLINGEVIVPPPHFIVPRGF